MKLADIDHANDSPLSRCLQRIETLLRSPPGFYAWAPAQYAAALADLEAARELLATDLLTLAQRVHTGREPIAIRRYNATEFHHG